jgi:hypothetical protein
MDRIPLDRKPASDLDVLSSRSPGAGELSAGLRLASSGEGGDSVKAKVGLSWDCFVGDAGRDRGLFGSSALVDTRQGELT